MRPAALISRWHMNAPSSRTAFDLLREMAAHAPDRDMAVAADGACSYADLVDSAARVAGALQEQGVVPGDRIGLLSDNRVEWLEIFFAAAALGAVVVPFSTWSTASELDFLIRDSRIGWLFTIDRFGAQRFAGDLTRLQGERTPDLHQIVSIEGNAFRPYSAFRDGPALADPPAVSGTDAMVILYTSGSSSRPKAVPLTHGDAILNGFHIGERQGLGPGDRVLVAVPLFWAYGAINALPATLTHGATLVLQGHFQAGAALDLIKRHRCTAIYTLPAMTNALVAHADFRPERTASLRTGVTIGAPQDIIKAARQLGAAQICNIYGGTENYGNCCVTPHDWPLEKRAACQGPPLPGVSLRIRGEDGALAPVGETGQIEVTGRLTSGYAGDSARHNDGTFTPDGWFRTGDLGSLDADGVLHFAGRSSEMIKRSGINVSPAEVEDVLQRHADVAIAGVTGLDDPDRGEIIVAFATPKPGRTLDAADVLAHCRAELSRYKVPDRLVVTDTLPLTVTGKLMRRELKAMAVGAGQDA